MPYMLGLSDGDVLIPNFLDISLFIDILKQAYYWYKSLQTSAKHKKSGSFSQKRSTHVARDDPCNYFFIYI